MKTKDYLCERERKRERERERKEKEEMDKEEDEDVVGWGMGGAVNKCHINGSRLSQSN